MIKSMQVCDCCSRESEVKDRRRKFAQIKFTARAESGALVLGSAEPSESRDVCGGCLRVEIDRIVNLIVDAPAATVIHFTVLW